MADQGLSRSQPEISALALVWPVQLYFGVQADAEPRLVEYRSLHASIHWHRLIQEERRKRRQNLVGLRGRHDDLRERAIMARDHEVVAVDARAMWDHQCPMRV